MLAISYSYTQTGLNIAIEIFRRVCCHSGQKIDKANLKNQHEYIVVLPSFFLSSHFLTVFKIFTIHERYVLRIHWKSSCPGYYFHIDRIQIK